MNVIYDKVKNTTSQNEDKQRQDVIFKFSKLNASFKKMQEAYGYLAFKNKANVLDKFQNEKKKMKNDNSAMNKSVIDHSSKKLVELKVDKSIRKINIITGNHTMQSVKGAKIKLLFDSPIKANINKKGNVIKGVYSEYEQFLFASVKKNTTKMIISPNARTSVKFNIKSILKTTKKKPLRRQNNFHSEKPFKIEAEKEDDVIEKHLIRLKELGLDSLLKSNQFKREDRDMILKEKRLNCLRRSIFKENDYVDDNDSLKNVSLIINNYELPKKKKQAYEVNSNYVEPISNDPSEIYFNKYYTVNRNGEIVKKIETSSVKRFNSLFSPINNIHIKLKKSISIKKEKSLSKSKSAITNYHKFNNLSTKIKPGLIHHNKIISESTNKTFKSTLNNTKLKTKHKHQLTMPNIITDFSNYNSFDKSFLCQTSKKVLTNQKKDANKKLKNISEDCSNILQRVDRINDTINLQNDLEYDANKFKKNELIKVNDPGIILFTKGKAKTLGKLTFSGLKTYESSQMFTDLMMKSDHVRKLNKDSTLKFSRFFKGKFQTYSEADVKEEEFKKILYKRNIMMDKVITNSIIIANNIKKCR
jgi:hypothetical protein